MRSRRAVVVTTKPCRSTSQLGIRRTAEPLEPVGSDLASRSTRRRHRPTQRDTSGLQATPDPAGDDSKTRRHAAPDRHRDLEVEDVHLASVRSPQTPQEQVNGSYLTCHRPSRRPGPAIRPRPRPWFMVADHAARRPATDEPAGDSTATTSTSGAVVRHERDRAGRLRNRQLHLRRLVADLAQDSRQVVVGHCRSAPDAHIDGPVVDQYLRRSGRRNGWPPGGGRGRLVPRTRAAHSPRQPFRWIRRRPTRWPPSEDGSPQRSITTWSPATSMSSPSGETLTLLSRCP